jgi:hypothetical protein
MFKKKNSSDAMGPPVDKFASFLARVLKRRKEASSYWTEMCGGSTASPRSKNQRRHNCADRQGTHGIILVFYLDRPIMIYGV